MSRDNQNLDLPSNLPFFITIAGDLRGLQSAKDDTKELNRLIIGLAVTMTLGVLVLHFHALGL